jgi:signal transduction histidine kinase
MILTFSYWQFKVIQDFHHNELRNFFSQTNNIVSVLIQQKKKDLKNFVSSHLHVDALDTIGSINDIDFVFTTKDSKVLQLEGFNLEVDVTKLANKLSVKTQFNNIEKVTVDNKSYYLLVYKDKIISKTVGKVVGELWAVQILNNNHTFINSLKSVLNIEELIMLDNKNVIVSTLSDEFLGDYTNTQKELIYKSKGSELLYLKNSLCKNLDVIYIVTNNSKAIYDEFILLLKYALPIMVIVMVLLFLFIRFLFINKLNILKNFIESRMFDKTVEYKESHLVEVDQIAYTFDKLYKEHKKLNNNLEKKVQEEIGKNRDKDKMLMQSSRLAIMGEMISMIAHQWRQPLAAQRAVVGSIELKRRLKKIDEEFLEKSLKEIDNLSAHMSCTIDDFANFFKPDKEKNSVDIKESIYESINLVAPTLSKNNISIDVNLDKKLENSCKINIYDREFKQVVINILNNAKDALIENRKIDREIKIDISKEDNNTIIKFRDNGGGIPEDILPKIFDPYFSTKSKNGTGLGLYMSKMIIDEHLDGSLSAYNNSNGAIFKIVL